MCATLCTYGLSNLVYCKEERFITMGSCFVKTQKYLVFLLFIVLACGCSSRASASFTYDESLPSYEEIAQYVSNKECIQYFQSIYWGYTPNKAFASSPDGACGFSAEEMSTIAFATESALRYCDLTRKKLAMVAECQIVNVNGEWQP